MNKKEYQKGVSLYLAIVVMALLLTIIIGVSAILTKQIKAISGMENSVLALYAADAGVEVALKDVFTDLNSVQENYSLTLANNAEYNVTVACCGAGPCPGICSPSISSPPDPNCSAYYYCIKSVGSFHGVRRALYINI